MTLTSWMQGFDIRSEMNEVYLHSLLFKLGVGLVSIFLPLYLVNNGYTLFEVLFFFAIYYGVYVFASFPTGYIASKIGFKTTSLLSSPLVLAFYLSLKTFPTEPYIYGVAVLGGFAFNSYWIGMNPEVAKSSSSKNREEETGLFISMPRIAAVISPLFGGLILDGSGFGTLLPVAAAVLGGSFVPFLFSREDEASGKSVNPAIYFDSRFLEDFATYFGKGVNSIGKKVLWPLYLALFIEESASIGGAGSLLALGSAAASIMAGRITDSENRGTVIYSGVLCTLLTYVAMSFVVSPVQALLVSLFNGIGRTFIAVPVYSKAIQRSEESSYVGYFAFRETALGAGRVLSLGLIALSLTLFQSFLASFLIVSSSLLIVARSATRI